jgi:hypothetical protein
MNAASLYTEPALEGDICQSNEWCAPRTGVELDFEAGGDENWDCYDVTHVERGKLVTEGRRTKNGEKDRNTVRESTSDID